MKPQKDEDALVDVLDVVLRDGAILRADVIISVADVPLVGIKLSAAIAGMETMTEYGLFERWDVDRRARAVERRQYGRSTDSTLGDGSHDRPIDASTSSSDHEGSDDEREDAPSE